ncbi:endonuclease domain-containing protein [Synechococcus sp. PCC 7336]|uniref:endonuclease domain-containing protein n=1 Tax=Synechococcus sp. PCC 7336 TaxID=195250 RepID=UPI0008FC1AED|nr:DUF559 domain-containing protein [Synechococcus sp. PCC 7336]
MKETSNRIRGTTPELDRAAKQLRKKLTPAEACLWQALRNRQLRGLRFRRQHPIDRFIADFYCPACKLAIEVDGAVHDDRTEVDAARTQAMEAYGCRVIRFANQQVLNDLDAVLDAIYRAATSRSPPGTGA